jgi:hypothetical protein
MVGAAATDIERKQVRHTGRKTRTNAKQRSTCFFVACEISISTPASRYPIEIHHGFVASRTALVATATTASTEEASMISPFPEALRHPFHRGSVPAAWSDQQPRPGEGFADQIVLPSTAVRR